VIPIPWSYVKSWNCPACGLCCRGYNVVLGFNEWVNIVRTYGIGVTEPSINKFYLRKKGDDTCIFLYKHFDTWLCGLQHMKPKACKLWPFKIQGKPKYGRPNEASYTYRGQKLFIYLDPSCIGIQWGTPTREFAYTTIPEIVEIALALRKKQFYSTANLNNYSPYGVRFIRRKKQRLI